MSRRLTIAVLVLLALPAAGAAAPIVQPPKPESLIEGHTVFTVITQFGNVGPVPLPDLDLNITLDRDEVFNLTVDLEIFSNLTIDLCIKGTQINGTIRDEEQVNGTASVNDTELVNESTGPVHPFPPTRPFQNPPRDAVCTVPRRPNTTRVTETFAAAVAVLVREYNPNNFDKLFINATVDIRAQVEANAILGLDVNETVTSTSDACTDFGLFPCVRRGNGGLWSRFPGVLWFNDQYLVGPNARIGSDDADGSPADLGAGPFPPGFQGPGALGPAGTGPLATGRHTFCADVQYREMDPTPEVPCDPNGTTHYRYPCGGAIMAVRQGMPDPRQVMAKVKNSPFDPDIDNDGQGDVNGVHPGTSGGTGSPDDQYAWVGLDLATTTVTTTGPGQSIGSALPSIQYVESYLITDPNDHSWTIDLYRARTQRTMTLDPFSDTSSTQTFYVWVVNTLGGAHFVPDTGDLNCMPFEDWMPAEVNQFIETRDCRRLPNNNPAPRNLNNVHMTPRDDPCSGYQEPSDNLQCYGGQPVYDADGDGDTDQADCQASRRASPLRLYNGLLYFRSQTLGAMDGSRTHGRSHPDANGCQTGTEWACPGNDDDAEGNSHPFHPSTHTTGDTQPCPRGNASQQQTGFQDNANGNHGGSATPTDTQVVHNNECDFTHAVWNVDIYFSASGRPFPPHSRSFAVQDTQGSDAAFSQTEQPGHP